MIVLTTKENWYEISLLNQTEIYTIDYPKWLNTNSINLKLLQERSTLKTRERGWRWLSQRSKRRTATSKKQQRSCRSCRLKRTEAWKGERRLNSYWSRWGCACWTRTTSECRSSVRRYRRGTLTARKKMFVICCKFKKLN